MPVRARAFTMGYSIPPFGSDVQHLRLFRSLRAAPRNMIGCATP